MGPVLFSLIKSLATQEVSIFTTKGSRKAVQPSLLGSTVAPAHVLIKIGFLVWLEFAEEGAVES